MKKLLLLFILFTSILYSDFELNNNLGYFRVDLQNNQTGIAPNGAPLRDNVSHSSTSGTVKISPNTTGYFSTSKIVPSSFDAWTKINITANLNNLSDLNVDVLDCSDNVISGFANLTPSSGEIDISSISHTAYPCLRIRLNLSDTDGIVPVVDDIKVSWHGLPVFLVNISGTETKAVGENLSYSVTYSISYVNDTNAVIYVPIDNINNYNVPYGQNPIPSFVSASNGGQFTSAAITVNGVNIPANSVYWNLGTLEAGTSSNLGLVIKSPNGQENNTKYNLQAFADSENAILTVSDSSATLPGNQPIVTTLTSTPVPAIRMTTSGGVGIAGEQIAYSGGSYTGFVNYNVNISNDYGNGKNIETLFNPLVETDLSDIVNKISAAPATGCGVTDFASLLTVNDGGTYNPTTKKITWDLENAHLIPGAGRNLTFAIDYNNCLPSVITPGTVVNAISTLTGRRIVANPSDNVAPVTANAPVRFGLDTTAKIGYAKGERINGGSQLRVGTDDLPTVFQSFGQSYSYLLSASNTGAVRVDKTLMIDMIPLGTKFSAASLPSSVGGVIYYSTDTTFTNPALPPTHDIANAPTDLDSGANNYWERLDTNPPADLSTVRWIAFYIPCLSSPVFPSAPGSSCDGKPSSVMGEIQVNLIPFGQPGFGGTDICSPYDLTNKGVFSSYAYATDINNADSDITVQSTAFANLNDNEVSHIKTSLADLNPSINGLSEVDAQTTNNFTLQVNNIGNDIALATTVRIDAPSVTVNGVPTKLSFVGVTGGSVNYSNLPNYITVSLGNINANSSKTISFNLNVPAGILDADSFTISAQVNANDDNSCATISKTTTKSIAVNSRTSVILRKTRDEAIIPSSGSINYKISFVNNGQSPTNNTYVIDKMPSRARFSKAFTSPALDENGNSFNCTNCQVFFAKDQAGLPTSISPANPLTPSIVSTYFNLGVENSPGQWVPNPSYCSPSEVVYVAYRVDDLSLPSPILKVGTNGSVGLNVINDDDSFGPLLDGSNTGEFIENVAAVVAGNLLQAIANQVVSVVLPDPGLKMNKTSSVEVLSAGKEFDWYIDYVNDSGTDDTEVIITDTLPFGTSLAGVFHSWNTQAANAIGTSTSEVNIASDANVSIVPLAGGLTEVRIIISDTDDVPVPGLRNGNLRKLEGGRIRLRVATDSSIQSGTVLNNFVSGFYENPANSYTVTDEDSVLIQNPDLSIVKLANVTNPVPGDNVSYTINIENHGGLAAPDVVITDTLPAGLCYVPNTVMLTGGYTIGEPTVVTSNCATAPTTLTWNSISNSLLGSQIIPGNSGSILFTYQAQVHPSIPAATNLKNSIGITTSLNEDQVYPNGSDFEVRTPLPDAYLLKSAPVTGLPGETFDFNLSYGNNQRVQAEKVYFIDRLPDYDNDGTVDLKVAGFTVSNGETVYCHNATLSSPVPTFDVSNPLTLGWVSQAQCLLAGFKPTHVAVLVGSLPAAVPARNVTITAELIDPDTTVNVGAGLSFKNQAVIFSELDDDMINNASEATIKTPGADLLITKTGNIEGASPGTLPGSSITYTITGVNNGTQDVCAIKVKDTLPSNMEPAGTLDSFSALTLTDSSDNTVFPNDALGSPITTAVSVTRSESAGEYTWKIGGTEYSNICLPPGAKFSFDINVNIKNTVTDGTEIQNCASITEDSPAVEDILGNNNDCSSVVVYQADLKVNKTGFSCGSNNSCSDGEPDNNSGLANKSELIKYKITYDNIGRYPAASSVITETIPAGSCYSVGSIEENSTLPGTIEYSLNNGATWSSTYTPTPDSEQKDCSITNFRLKFASDLPAPATFFAQDTKSEFALSKQFGTKATEGSSNTGQIVLGGNGDQSHWDLTNGSVEGSYSETSTNGELNTFFHETGNSLNGSSLFFTDDNTEPGKPKELDKGTPYEFMYTRNNSGSGLSDYAYTQKQSYFSHEGGDLYGNFYNNFHVATDGKTHFTYMQVEYINNYDYTYHYSSGVQPGDHYSYDYEYTYNLRYWDEALAAPRTIMSIMSDYSYYYDYYTGINTINNNNNRSIGSVSQFVDSSGIAHVTFVYSEPTLGSHLMYWNSSMADNAPIELKINGSQINSLWGNYQLPKYENASGDVVYNFIAYNNTLGRYAVYSWDSTLIGVDATEQYPIVNLNTAYSHLSDDVNNKNYLTYSIYDSSTNAYKLYLYDSSTNAARLVSSSTPNSFYPNDVNKIVLSPNGDVHIIFRSSNDTWNYQGFSYWNSSLADASSFVISRTYTGNNAYSDDTRITFDNAGHPHIVLSDYNYVSGGVSGNQYNYGVSYWNDTMPTSDFSSSVIYEYQPIMNYGSNVVLSRDYNWLFSPITNDSIRIDSTGKARIVFSTIKYEDFGTFGIQGIADLYYYSVADGLKRISRTSDSSINVGYQERYEHDIDASGISHVYYVGSFKYHEDPSYPLYNSSEIYYWNSGLAADSAIRKTGQIDQSQYQYEFSQTRTNDGTVYAIYTPESFTSEGRNVVLESNGANPVTISNIQLSESSAYQPKIYGENSNQPKAVWLEYVYSNTQNGDNENSDLFIYPSGDGGLTGTATTPVIQASSGNLVGWGNLILNYSTPEDSSMTFDVLDSADTPIPGYTGLANTGLIDLSGLSVATYPKIKIRSNFNASSSTNHLTPILEKLVVTYFTDQSPFFTFKVRVKSSGFSSYQILNNVNITTETSEISDTNNASSYLLDLIKTNIKVDKIVNKTSARQGENLSYIIRVCNDGATAANSISLEDFYPTGLILNSHSCSDSGVKLDCSIGSLAAGECRDINISATIKNFPDVVDGDNLTNLACIKVNDIIDTVSTDNCDSVNTVVADLANVYISKTGALSTGIDKEMTYTITYGNSGNIAANDVKIVDPIDLTKVSFVSANDISGTPYFTCSLNGSNVTCNSDGSALGSGISLPSSAFGTIQVKVRVNNDQSLIANSSIIHNSVNISTSTPQVNIGDDDDSHDVPVVLSGLGAISGKVYSDIASNLNFDSSADTGILNAKVLVLGYDIFGKVWGPAATEVGYTEFANSIIPDLITAGVVPGGTTAASLSSLVNYNIIAPVSSDALGNYSVVGLNPGIYNIYQPTPTTHYSIGSDAGQANITADDTISLVPGHGLGSKEDVSINKSLVKTIDIRENMSSVDNNFALGTGVVGNFVFKDLNGNGVYDPATETGLANIEVSLYKDLNDNGLFDVTDTLISSKLTDGNGAYQFTGLLLDDGDGDFDYIVKVTDSLGLISDYVATVGTLGLDNNSQPVAGYKVSLNSTIYTNNTADFGYFQKATLGDRVWFDANQDGVQNGSEVGIAGITVKLYNSSNTLIETQVTNGTGNYLFEDIAPGDYYIEIATGSYLISPKNATTANFDSDINATKKSDVITLAANTENLNLDAGLYLTSVLPSTIDGLAWYDNNKDGIRDLTDTGLPGITVELRKSDGTLVSTTVSDSNGNYTFSGLLTDNYYLEFKDLSGYSRTLKDATTDNLDSDADLTTGITPTFILATGENKSGVDAGYYITNSSVTPASIGDKVWFDLDQNGIQGTTETGISGIIVKLYKSDNTLVSTGTTDLSGNYNFSNILPGTYYLVFTPTGSYQYTIRDFGGNDSEDSDANPLNGKTNIITLVSGDVIDNVDAGFHLNGTLPGSIGDRVWFDLNKDGIENSEPGLSGVVVKLLNNIGDVVSSVTTDASGNYQFTNIIPGDYSLEFTPPTSLYQLSPSLQGADATVDSNILSSGRTSIVTLGSNQALTDIDGAYYASGFIGNKVFGDINSNGVLDGNDFGIQNVGIKLYRDVNKDGLLDSADTLVASSVTDGNGEYLFSGLQVDDGSGSYTYLVVVNDTAGILTKATHTLGTVGLDNNSQKATGYQVILTTSNYANFTADFGYHGSADIGDTIWYDTDHDGVFDTNEMGVSGVKVELIKSGETNPSQTVYTDGLGKYKFKVYQPGKYKVRFTYPSGYQITTPYVGGDSNFDSDLDSSLALSTSTLISAFDIKFGDNNLTLDGGIFAAGINPSSIGDRAWVDSNNNGIFDGTESGIPGIKVNLLDASNTVIASVVSDSNGYYYFNGLLPGSYKVSPELPAGITVTTVNAGDDALDSDINADLKSDIITLTSGSILTNIDIGLISSTALAELGNFVWLDSDTNGVQGAGETGIPGVLVELYSSTDSLIASTVTNTVGEYKFNNLIPGSYYVKFIPQVSGYQFSAKGVGTSTDSDADSTGKTGLINLTAGLSELSIDAGLSLVSGTVGSIGSLVWNDVNANGIRDAGESLLPGITVILYRNDGTQVASAVTDANGEYLFRNLAPGDYYIGFVLPTGYLFTTTGVGDTLANSDAVVATGRTIKLTLNSGAVLVHIDAGIYFPVTDCDGPSNSSLQVSMDGNARVLAARVSSGLILRNKAKRSCGSISNSLSNKYKLEADSLYNSLWRTIWTGLPATNDSNFACSCTQINISGTVNSILSDTTKMTNLLLNKVLPNSCYKKVRDAKMKRLIKQHRDASVVIINSMKATANSLPQPMYDCK